MRRTATKVLLLILILILQIMFLPFFINPWPHSPMVDVGYRQKERLAASTEQMHHPSAETRATFGLERHRMDRYVAWSAAGLVFVLALVDWAVIHYILDSQRKHRITKPGAPRNSGPAEPLHNSGVSGGPPSVS